MERSLVTLSVSLVVDLIIVAVLLLSLIVGWAQGMVRSILTLVGTLLALVVAAQIASYASGIIVEQVIRPATYEAITARVEELSLQELFISPLEEMERVIDAIENDLVREEAYKLLNAMGLSTEAAEGTAKDTLLTISGELVDTVLYGAVREIISSLICLLCFALISVALRPVIWMVCKAFELPLLRQFDQLGGLLLGAVRGLLLVFVAVWALRLFGLWITEETIAHSYLLPPITQFLDFHILSGVR